MSALVYNSYIWTGRGDGDFDLKRQRSNGGKRTGFWSDNSQLTAFSVVALEERRSIEESRVAIERDRVTIERDWETIERDRETMERDRETIERDAERSTEESRGDRERYLWRSREISRGHRERSREDNFFRQEREKDTDGFAHSNPTATKVETAVLSWRTAQKNF